MPEHEGVLLSVRRKGFSRWEGVGELQELPGAPPGEQLILSVDVSVVGVERLRAIAGNPATWRLLMPAGGGEDCYFEGVWTGPQPIPGPNQLTFALTRQPWMAKGAP